MIKLVIRASNLLRVDELQLFNLAYRFWYDRKAEARHINKVFTHYLHKKIAPPWVAHFARSVLQAYQSGDLDPIRFGIYPEFEELPLGWSLVFKTPRTLPLNNTDEVLIA
jgi:hypothetical protein